MDTTDKFCLRWDSRGDTFAKIKDYHQFFDCTLITDDDEANSLELRAHKVILSVCSEFFDNILTRASVCSHPNPLIYIRGISTKDMQNILHFIYNAEVTIARKDVDHFLEVAEILKIKGLTKGPIGTMRKLKEDNESSNNVPLKQVNIDIGGSHQTKNVISDEFEVSEKCASFDEIGGGEEMKAWSKEDTSIQKEYIIDDMNQTNCKPTTLGTLLAERLQAPKNEEYSQTGDDGEKKSTTLALAHTKSSSVDESNQAISNVVEVVANTYNDEFKKFSEGNIRQDKNEDGIQGDWATKETDDISDTEVEHAEREKMRKDNEHGDMMAHIEEVHKNADLSKNVGNTTGEANRKKDEVSGEEHLSDEKGTEVKQEVTQELGSDRSVPKRYVRRGQYYYCVQCPKVSHHSAEMITHVEVVHKTFERYVCKECGYRASRRDRLDLHIEGVHKGFKKFGCELCPKQFGRKCKLNDHMKTKHEEVGHFACKECDFVASRKSQLRRHMASVHRMGDNIFKCEQCPFATISRSGLKVHIDGVHNDIRNHVCEECGYAAKQISTLISHKENIHNKGEVFKCDKCDFTSLRKDGVKVHNKTVHEEKKFVCEDCGYGFAHSHALRKHRETVHNLGEKPFKCEYCDYASHRMTGLKQHRSFKGACRKRNAKRKESSDINASPGCKTSEQAEDGEESNSESMKQ